MNNNIKKWFAERIPFTFESFKAFGSEPVPHHLKHWWWALGGTPAYLFVIQMITGVLLLFYYIPAEDAAYNSVKNITENISYGWYIRSMHYWSANFMIMAVILHVFRVFFTGSYRKPREINWMVGTVILAVTLLLGFTGYSLIYEQLSYWGITVVTQLLDAIPLIGQFVGDFFRGGKTIGQGTLSRVFIFHVAILPGLLIVLLTIHIAYMHTQGITKFKFAGDKDKKSFPFVPDHLITEIIIALILMFLMTCLAIIFPVHLGSEANPQITPDHIKPEWYFYFAFRILKLTSDTGAVLIMGFGYMLLMFWPLIDSGFRQKKPESERSILIGIFMVLTLVFLTLWEALELLFSH